MAKISLDNKDFDKGVSDATNSGKTFASKMGGFATGAMKTVGTLSVAIGGALTAIGGFSLNSAMELEASEAKYKTVFGEFTDTSDAFLKEFQKLTPATTAEVRNMASGIQDMLVPLGFAREEATNMTGEFMHVIGALTNFNSGTETAESVSAKFTAAMTGELDGLKSLGIQLDADTVKQKAVEMGLAATTKEVGKQEIAQVVLAEAYKQSGDALAAYNEESLDAKTKFGLLKAEIQDVSAEMGSKFLPIVNDTLGALKDGFEKAIPFIEGATDGLLNMINGVEGGAEQFKENITNMLNGLLDSIVGMIPVFTDIALQIILAIVETILANLPQILEAGINMLITLAGGIAQQLPTLIPLAIECVLNLVDTLLNNIDQLVDAGIELIIGLADGLIEALPILIEKIPIIIEKLVMGLANNVPKLVESGVKLLVGVATGLIQAIPQLLTAIPKIITSLVNGYATYIGEFINVGKNIVKGVWDGIVSMGTWITDKVKGFFSGIVGSVKKVLNIHSPSRVFRDEIGAMMAQGVGVGFADEMDEVNADIEKSLNSTVKVASDTDQVKADNGIGQVVALLQQLLEKDTIIEMDGRTVGKALAPYKDEINSYDNRNIAFA